MGVPERLCAACGWLPRQMSAACARGSRVILSQSSAGDGQWESSRGLLIWTRVGGDRPERESTGGREGPAARSFSGSALNRQQCENFMESNIFDSKGFSVLVALGYMLYTTRNVHQGLDTPEKGQDKPKGSGWERE